MFASNLFLEETLTKMVWEKLGEGAEDLTILTPDDWEGIEQVTAFPETGVADLVNEARNVVGKVTWKAFLMLEDKVWKATVLKEDLKVTLTVPRCPFCKTLLARLRTYYFDQIQQDVSLSESSDRNRRYMEWDDLESIDGSCKKIEFTCPECARALIIDNNGNGNNDHVIAFLNCELTDKTEKDFPIIDGTEPKAKTIILVEMFQGINENLHKEETMELAEKHFEKVTGVSWEDFGKRSGKEDNDAILGDHAGTGIFEV